MESKRFSLPNQRNYEYAYNLAYKLAREELAKIQDIAQQCRRSGAHYQEIDSQKLITLEYLNRSYQITLPDIDVTLVDSQEPVPLKTKVLLLHYFIRAKGAPPSGKMITFKELPGGTSYFPTFIKRTINPLLKRFGKEPQRLLETARKLGGHKADYGDVAVTIDAFCYVPLTFVLWRGDAEFTPSASIMFDATITDYLAAEDIVVVCETIAWTIVRSLG